MGYYLNKIEDTQSKYKYQYLHHIETAIDIRQNYWQFKTQLFCINNYSLPPGTLVANLALPYQEVKDIAFFLATDQSKAKEKVTYDKKYAHIYESNFNVDVSSNQFFTQNINNTKINCSLKLEIDPQVIKNAGVQLDQVALDELISNTSEQRWDFSMYYSNTYIVNNTQSVSNINGYCLDSGHDCSSLISLVDVSSSDYSNNLTSISELVKFKSNTIFQILQAKVKFYYWLEDETECKTLETNLFLERKSVNEQTLNLNQNTKYDFVNNKVILDNGGIQGFYIPKYSHGYYEIELLFSQTNNITKFIIKNNFTFNNNIRSPQICLSKTRIDNLFGFKKVRW